MKPLFGKNELKGKGLDKHKVKSKVPKELKKVDGHTEKPTIELNFSDYFNRFSMWFQGYAIDIGSGIIKRIIPGWVWILLVVGVLILLWVVL